MEKKHTAAESSENTLLETPVEKLLFQNLKRAYDSLHVKAYQLFKPFKITIGQFDLMESILNSPEKVLSIQQIAQRTVSLQPNVTRSVGILEKTGLVSCTKNASDGRIVMVKLTKKGARLISEIQKPLLDLHIEQFKDFNRDELRLFNIFVKRIVQTKE